MGRTPVPKPDDSDVSNGQDSEFPIRTRSLSPSGLPKATPNNIMKRIPSSSALYPSLGSEIPQALESLSVEPSRTNAELFNICI